MNAAAAAAAAGGLHVPQAPPLNSFSAYYATDSTDEYQGEYQQVMNEFRTVGGRAPNELRQLTSANDDSSLGYLYLLEAPGAPNHPGYLHLIHTVSKYPTRLGFPATVWDNVRFGTIGDVVQGQVPNTVYFPTDSFVMANAGNLILLPTPARLTAEYLTSPNLQLAGPYQAGAQGTEYVRVRTTAPVPH